MGRWVIDVHRVQTSATWRCALPDTDLVPAGPLPTVGGIRSHHGPVPPGPSATNKVTANRTVTLICGPQGNPPHYKTSKTPAGVLSSPSSDSYFALTMPSFPSSPARHTRNSAGRFSAIENPPAKQLCDDMDNEMRYNFLGPMPVEQFFQKFLPLDETPPSKVRVTWPGFEAVAKAKKETAMYDKFVRRLFQPVYFSFPIVSLSLGRHCEFILSQHQSIQLIKRPGHRTRCEVQARYRFL